MSLAGRGKTHLTAAIGREWIRRHQLRVLFVPAFKLVNQLLSAKRDLKLPQVITRLRRFDAVVIDDIGYPSRTRGAVGFSTGGNVRRYSRAKGCWIWT